MVPKTARATSAGTRCHPAMAKRIAAIILIYLAAAAAWAVLGATITAL